MEMHKSSLPRILRDRNGLTTQKTGENWGWWGVHLLTHSHTMTPFDAPGKQAF